MEHLHEVTLKCWGAKSHNELLIVKGGSCQESMAKLKKARLFVSATAEPNQQKVGRKIKNYHANLEKS